MARAIEQTPILEGKDATRFLDIVLSSKNDSKINFHEQEVKEIIKKMPKHLKI